MSSTSRRSSRRQFLITGASTLTGVGVLSSNASATPARIDPSPWGIAIPPSAQYTCASDWMPAYSSEQFRDLALIAMDVAKEAGADFADIRIGLQRQFSVPVGTLRCALKYGIRARVNGVWGFQHGDLLTRDTIAAAARGAVDTARTNGAINRALGQTTAPELVPAPVVTGTWHVPMEIDPFTVPFDDGTRTSRSLTEPIRRLGHVSAGFSLSWTGDTRVFASTTGSLVTQELLSGGANGGVSAFLPDNVNDIVKFSFDILESRGYESVLRPEIPEQLTVLAEEAIRWRELPLGSMRDIGRYPVIFGGDIASRLLGQTIGLALDGDRVAGLESDTAGPTFLTPLGQILGTDAPAFSPLLTVTSHRSLPSVAAVRWDDDGVEPIPHTLIDRGHVVDYHTTRETAPMLTEWYQRTGRPLRSNGNSIARTAASVPVAGTGHLEVTPSAQGSLYDFIREMTHGFVVMQGLLTTSPKLSMGYVNTLNEHLVLEIRNGKPIARIPRLQIAFGTKSLLKDKLIAVGNVQTVRTGTTGIRKGVPWEYMRQPVSSPALYCKDVDVIRWDLMR